MAKTYIKIYQQKLSVFEIPYKEKIIETSFGKTNVIITNGIKKPPLVVLHGLNSAAPFVLDTTLFLSEKYQIFAIDIIGQPNKSDFVRLNKKNDSYGKWLLEIIDDLQIENITFCGISFGAFPVLKSLIIDDKKIKEVFLISPAAIIHGNLWQTVFKFLIPLKKFQKTQNDLYLKNCLSSIYDELDKLTLDYQKEVFTNFKMDFSLTPNFKKSALKKIKTPVNIIASKNDFFVPAKKLKNKCGNLLNLKKFISLEDSKHIASKTVLKDVFIKLIS
ncbi:alpha/beta hydrolase [Polaribacter sp. Asnod6-C07]|uniref:alpha/beta hydrolase n=1 Tax=Polaribacter sp. Asnod6-C07 TaxID=3160582 RepID=UPI0038686B17